MLEVWRGRSPFAHALSKWGVDHSSQSDEIENSAQRSDGRLMKIIEDH